MYIMTEDGWRLIETYCDNSNDLRGVFRVTTVEKVQKELDPRIDRFLDANDGQAINRAFRGTHFVEPLFGAFGERL